MGRIISLEEAVPEAAPPPESASEFRKDPKKGRMISLEEATGVPMESGPLAFAKDPENWKAMGGYALGVGAQLSDMFTGLGKSLLGGTAYLLERSATKGQATHQAPIVYDGQRLSPSGDWAQKRSAAKAQTAKDLFPEELAAPWSKVAKAMGPEAVKAYEENGVGWVMGKLSELIEKGGEGVEKAWGLPASDFVNAVDLATGVLGAVGFKVQAQRALEARRAELHKKVDEPPRTEPELEPEPPPSGPPEGMPAAAANIVPRDPSTPAPPPPPRAGQFPPKDPTITDVEVKGEGGSAPAPEFDPLDPYKVAGVAVAGTGAAAWMMQNELSDEQLAGLGVLGAAGIIKLKGVPEANLIDMLKQGGPAREAAAAQIYRDNVPMLTRSLYKYAKDGVEVEDAVQRTMEKGLRAIEKGQFSGDSAISTYLYRIAENEAKSKLRYDGVRPRTESLDNTERPGAGKGDESLPSPHEQVADTSLTGRSPEQAAMDRAMGEKMSAALDKLPENFRKPFEMRELDGMDYAEIAEALGQPIGTVRSQISRAKEQLQRSLREYGKPAAGGAALAALFAVTDEERREGLGLGMAVALGAMKAKGGMWHPHAAGKFGEPLAETLGTSRKGDAPDLEATRMVEGYLKKHAGTATDPLNDLQLPDGTRWEDAMDQALGSRPAKDFGKGGSQGAIKGLNKLREEGKVSPDEPIYDVGSPHFPRQFGHSGEQVGASVGKIQDYLTHVGDYMRLEVPVAKWGQYDLVRAVKETKAWDEKMARDAEKAREKEQNKALTRMASMETVMDFPATGMRLVKLDKPGDFAHESTVMGHSVRGYEPPAAVSRAMSNDSMARPAHPDWVPESETGMNSARYGSGHPEYGLGGWEAIKSGDAEILSLRDAKGQSHVTIEIEAGKKNWATGESHPSHPPSILQIKGKGNQPIAPRYQQEIADFLNSREWGQVDDLHNAGLWTFHRLPKKYWTDADVMRAAPSITPDDLHWYKQGMSLEKGAVVQAIDRIAAGAELPVEPKLIEEAAARLAKLEPYRDQGYGGIGHTRESILHEIEQLNNNILAWNRGRQRPDLQAGFASPAQMFTIAATLGGATLGAYLDPENPLSAALYGALGGGFLSSAAGRASLKKALKDPDYVMGLTSTRLGKINPELKARYRDHERRVLKALDTTHDQVTPFLDALRKQSKGVQEQIARDLMNGKLDALRAISTLRETYPKVQATLKNIEAQLQSLGRFGEGVGEYFPRIVKDFAGLRAALDLPMKEGLMKAMADAEAKMMRTKQRPLTEVEQSLVANRYLFGNVPGSSLPGYARSRKIREVTEKLQPFYESPAESLLRYLTGSIRDIEAARFFGRDLKVNSKGEKKFTNVDTSIGELTARLIDEGKITAEQAREVQSILKSRFEGGEKSMNETLAATRDLTNAALLGNFWAASTQIGDSLLNVYHFGLGPTLQGVMQRVSGKSVVTPKDLGLINHIAEELSGRRLPGEVLHTTLKWSGFQAIDQFAKGVGINAALAKAKAQARTPKGLAALQERYGYAFGEEFPQLIADLKAGKNTRLTQSLAFEALSDVQPISKAEMPQAYLDNPNGRILYQLKTYMLKQADIVRREAYDNLAAPGAKKKMIGLKNLAALASVYALANVPGDVIKDWLSGREVDPFDTPKLVENVFQTFGFNRYAQRNIGEGKVVETGVKFVTPPWKVLEDLAFRRERSVSYIPIVGRGLYDREFDGNVKREIAEKRLANKGLPAGTGQELSEDAKDYLRRLREERARKKAEKAALGE